MASRARAAALAATCAAAAALYIRGRMARRKNRSVVKSATALGLLVADALKDRGWRSVDRASIQVENLSGMGGSQTYRVSAPDVAPSSVALHCRDMTIVLPAEEKRLGAASRVLSEHGLTPPRLAEGVDWFIEPWEGTGRPTITTVADMRALGTELAKLHKTPTAWYAPFRAQLKEDYPFLAKVPDDSHI